MPYDTAIIRKLLQAALSDAELDTLCFDHFRQVYDEITSGMNRLSKVQRLIEYCEQHLEFERLLSKLEQINPNQYKLYFPHSGPQILVIEDDEYWSKKIAARLQKLGYQVQSVPSYEQASQKLEEQPFDLAVVNIALQREMPPDWKADWSRLLGDIQQQETDLVVVTSIDETLKTQSEIEKLKTRLDIHHEVQHYDAGIFFKTDFAFREFEAYVSMKLERRKKRRLST